jgi:hypothetical protein
LFEPIGFTHVETIMNIRARKLVALAAKAGGYKIVHLKSRTPVATLPQYDEEIQKDRKLSTVSQRPTSTVVRDVR